MMQKKGSLIKSFGYAFQGIFTSLAKERNLKIHFAIAILVVIFGFLLKIALWEWIVCLILFGLVISLELANTAIEEVVDLASPKWHEKAKQSKRRGSRSSFVLGFDISGYRYYNFCSKVISNF